MISPPLYKFGRRILLNSNGTLNSLNRWYMNLLLCLKMSNTTKILMTQPKHSHLGKEVLFICSFPGHVADVGPVLAAEDAGIPQCKCEFAIII